MLDLEQECLDKGGLLICAGNLFTVKSTQWPRAYSWDTVYFSSNSIFCNPPLSACTLREQSVQKHEGESVKEFLLYLLLTGPNSGAGTRHWSARVHCRVHGHAQLWQVPWAWGVIMLLPVLLWLVRRRMTTRRRKWMHRRSSVCMWVFFSMLFKARYFHSSETRLHLHLVFPAGTINALRVNRLTLDHVVLYSPCLILHLN